MNDFSNFTSLPPDQERGFVVYEQRTAEAQQKAFTVAIVSAIAVLVIALGIYLGVAPDETDISKDMNMSNLTRAPAQTATPASISGGSSAPTPAPATTDTTAPAGSAAPAPTTP